MKLTNGVTIVDRTVDRERERERDGRKLGTGWVDNTCTYATKDAILVVVVCRYCMYVEVHETYCVERYQTLG